MYASAGRKDDYLEIAKELYSSSEECPTPVTADVKGKIPEWFEGCLLRVGPGKFEWGKSTYKHWFDGQALMHKFQVCKGRVHYSSQFLHSKSYDTSKKYGRVALPGFGTWAPPDPCKNIFQRFFLWFMPLQTTDNCNVNMVEIKDETYATTETSYLYQVDPDTLRTMVEEDIQSTFPGPRSLLAHPHEDKDGTVYNVCTSVLKKRFEIMRIPAKVDDEDPFAGAKIVSRVPFSFGKQPYMHSFGITENYFILLENPFVLSKSWKVFFMNWFRLTFLDLMKWKPDLKSRIHVIDRKTGAIVKTTTTDPFFAFHHANAYEEAGKVIIDVSGYPDTSILDAFYMCNLRKGLEGVDYNTSVLRRYTVPLREVAAGSGQAESQPKLWNGQDFETICDGFEMPRINYAYSGRKYRFLFGVVFAENNIFLSHLAKVNVDTKEVTRWEVEHCYPSEPTFIAAPNATEEDDGIVLSIVVGVLGKPSFLLFLDGKTFKEVARAVVPHRLALTFHGQNF